MIPDIRQERGTAARQLAAPVLAALLAAGLLLRFHRLDTLSLWLDELWTAAATDPALPLGRAMDAWILPDVHPPLYYLAVRAWRTAFGGDEWALRLPSALASAACVAVVPLIQRWTPVVRRPLALTTWFAVSAGAIWYAQEARAYALLLLLATAATCLSVAIAVRIRQGRPILGGAVVLAAVVLALEYTHYFGVLVGAGAFGGLLLFALVHGDRRALAPIVAAGAAAFLLFLPWLALHLPHLTGKLGGHFWIANDWTATFRRFAGFAAGTPALLVAIAGTVAGTLALRPRRALRPDYFVPLAFIGITLSAALAISLHTPVATDRNLFILLPAFYVVAIAALGDLEEAAEGGWRSFFALLPAAIAALNLGLAAHRVLTGTKDEWRAAAVFVASLPGCEEGPLPVNRWPTEVYAYYLPPSLRQRLVAVDVNDPRSPSPSLAATLVAGDCPLLLWTGNAVGPGVVGPWLEKLGVDRSAVSVRAFAGHDVVLRRGPAAGNRPRPGVSAAAGTPARSLRDPGAPTSR